MSTRRGRAPQFSSRKPPTFGPWPSGPMLAQARQACSHLHLLRRTDISWVWSESPRPFFYPQVDISSCPVALCRAAGARARGVRIPACCMPPCLVRVKNRAEYYFIYAPGPRRRRVTNPPPRAPSSPTRQHSKTFIGSPTYLTCRDAMSLCHFGASERLRALPIKQPAARQFRHQRIRHQSSSGRSRSPNRAERQREEKRSSSLWSLCRLSLARSLARLLLLPFHS